MVWSLLLPPSSLSCLIEKRKRRADTDPVILTCCCSRTQAFGFFQPLLPYSLPLCLGSRHLGPSLPLLFSLPNHLSWDPVILATCTLRLSPKHFNWVSNCPSFHCQGPSQIPGNLVPQLCILILACGSSIDAVFLNLSSCLWDIRLCGDHRAPWPFCSSYPFWLSRGVRRGLCHSHL